MTKKDFEVFARALMTSRPLSVGTVKAAHARAQWRRDCYEVATVFAADNARFDPRRFFLACGMEEEEVANSKLVVMRAERGGGFALAPQAR